MEETLKKLLYTGVGLAATASEKIHATVQDLVDKSNLPAEEGKKVLEDISKNTSELKEEVELKLKNAYESIVAKFDGIEPNETDEMKSKVKDLEAKLEQYEKESKKAPTKISKTVSVK